MSFEKGLYFRNGEFMGILNKGRYWFLNPFVETRVDIVSQRSPWLFHRDLDVIIASGSLKDDARVIDLKDDERALVWIEGRFAQVLTSGQYVLWNKYKDVKVEIVSTEQIRFEHDAAEAIMHSCGASELIEEITIPEGRVGLFFIRGDYAETLLPGRYLCWKNAGMFKVHIKDMREQVFDLSGQDIITADKVTLRVNAVVTYQEQDPVKSFSVAENAMQSLYRDAQLALRTTIGMHDLDAILADKNSIVKNMEAILRERADEFGIKIVAMGIRDVILPGDMKILLNKVTEAKKVAEANIIARREEVAAMRSQANSAKMLESSPTLMRLRELESLERVAAHAKLSVVLGDKGLTKQLVNLL